MSTNQRNEFFTAMLTGVMANPVYAHAKGNTGCMIRRLWTLADMAVYHSERMETPKERAKRWIKRNFAIVDTETTGLGEGAQIVEIAIIDCTGATLLYTLVKPTIAIPPEATAIHGITNEMVKDAPEWKEIEPEVMRLINRGWVAYNAGFDDRMILDSTVNDIDYPTPECAMELFAECNGEWDAYRAKYKWKKLVEAAEKLNAIPDDSFGLSPHRALYDCYMTLGVVRAIAEGDL